MPTNSIRATNCESFPNPPLSVSLVTNSDYPGGTLTVDWFDAATGGNMVAVNTLQFVPPDNAPAGPNSAAFYTYWAQARALSTGATSRSRTPATLQLNPRPRALVSGSTNICLGGSTTIYASLVGIGPWTNSWASNGIVIVTNILTTNFATLMVSPKTTTTYTIATLAQSGCSAMPGDLIGSATVTVFALPNDQCAGAIPMFAGSNYYMNTACATNLGDPTPSCATTASKGVWYGFVPNRGSKLTISTCGSDFDTVLAVYTGGCGFLKEIACNNDYGPDCAGTSASVSFNSPAFTPYWILAAGYNGSNGNLVIHATECDFPGPAQITSVIQSTQPDGVHVQFCAFAFLATSYTWSLDGTPLSQTGSCIEIVFSPTDDVTHIVGAIGQNNCGSGDSGSAPITTCSVCLSRGTPSLLTGTTGSGTAPTRTNQCGILSSSTHWYKMIATNDTGLVTVSAETNAALLAVYTGPLTNLIFVGCAPTNLPSRVTFNALQYAVYWIAVDQGTNVATLHLASGFEPYIQNYGVANGAFQLRSSIAPAIPYSLLSSSNLSSSNWSVVLTTNLTTDVPYLYYRETNMMNFPQRYYRLAP